MFTPHKDSLMRPNDVRELTREKIQMCFDTDLRLTVMQVVYRKYGPYQNGLLRVV
jgi:hypothetical protein